MRVRTVGSVDDGEQMIRNYFIQKVSSVHKFIGGAGGLWMKIREVPSG